MKTCQGTIWVPFETIIQVCVPSANSHLVLYFLTAAGVLYKDDPTIFAWNLINQPRCEEWVNPNCQDDLHNWLATMSAFMKSQDPNHMVTYGVEGFYGPGPHARLNPKPWMSSMGQDWVRNSGIRDIDYLSLHMWPDNWDMSEEEQQRGSGFSEGGFVRHWMLSHVDIAQRELGGKPLVLEEFGKKMAIGSDSDSSLGECRGASGF